MSVERESCLSCCEITQLADVGLWRWQQTELEALSDLNISQVGNIILNRLVSGNCEVTDCYINFFNDNVIHCVIRFATKDKGVKASQIANLVGVDVSCIKKSSKGRYGYRHLLAKLISVRDDGSFEYKAEDVITVKGRNYIDCYCEYHSDWLRGLKNISSGNVEVVDFNQDNLVSLVNCINKNDILYYCDLSDLILQKHPELFSSVVVNSEWLKTYLDSRKSKFGNV